MTAAAVPRVEVHAPPLVSVEKVRVVWYTDPYNVWCWGCEPGVRRLEARYADAVVVEEVMGGLFEDFGPMKEQWSRMSGGRWQDSVLAFLNAVADHHRMPMDTSGMASHMEDLTSTWPSCVAVKAASLQSGSAGHRYLRALREALYIEGRPIHRRDVQIAVAGELGLSVSAFTRSLEDGTADAAFRYDLERCRDRGVTGFPTFELMHGTASVRMEGWQPWDAFDEAVQNLNSALNPRPMDATPQEVLRLLRRFGRCATLEVAAVLGVTDDEAEILLEELEARGVAVRREVGKGLFWALAGEAAAREGVAGEGSVPRSASE